MTRAVATTRSSDLLRTSRGASTVNIEWDRAPVCRGVRVRASHHLGRCRDDRCQWIGACDGGAPPLAPNWWAHRRRLLARGGPKIFDAPSARPLQAPAALARSAQHWWEWCSTRRQRLQASTHERWPQQPRSPKMSACWQRQCRSRSRALWCRSPVQQQLQPARRRA